MQSFNCMKTDKKPANESRSFGKARIGMAVHYTHLALAVSVMDLYFDRSKADHEERKAEIKGALQAFRDVSWVLGRSLDLL